MRDTTRRWAALLSCAIAACGAIRAQSGELNVDLSGSEYESIEDTQEDVNGKDDLVTKVRDWFRRFEIWGYLATDYLHTGRDGLRPRGDVFMRHLTLFTRAEVTDDASFFVEIQPIRFPKNDRRFEVREVYAQISDLTELEGEDYISLKVGRVNLPFGQYYNQEDAIDNLLITYPIALPYGVDEGVHVYGRRGDFLWSAALLEGSYASPSESRGGKAAILRVHHDVSSSLSWTASVWTSGSTQSSSLCFSGATITPVGKNSATSALGATTSARVKTSAYVLDAKWTHEGSASLQLSAGQAFLNDSVDAFDRDFIWWTFEPTVNLSPVVRGIFRWSEAGTYDADEGYLFRGLSASDGAALYGYDTKRAQRLSLGAHWQVKQNMILKLEVGRDRFWTIDASNARPGASRNEFVSVEFVVRF